MIQVSCGGKSLTDDQHIDEEEATPKGYRYDILPAGHTTSASLCSATWTSIA